MKVVRLLALCLLVLPTLGAQAADGQTPFPQPILPVATTLQHWTHHWFVWLPKHAKYESVEIACNEAPAGGSPVVWVWFTERENGKRQVHYFNDQTLLRGRQDAFYRQMTFEMSNGAAGRSVQVSLMDKDDNPVEIRVDVDPAGALEHGGLTNQSGHALDSVFMVFFRGLQIQALRNHVTIGGTDYSFNTMDGLAQRFSFKAAYSRDIYIALIVYSESHVRWDGGSLVHSWGRTLEPFREDGRSGLRSGANPRGERIVLETTGDNLLTAYEHQVGDHRLRIRLGDPLQIPADGMRFETTFGIDLDGNRDLITGRATVAREGGAVTMRWSPEQPDWARASPVVSRLVLDADGKGYALAVGRATEEQPANAAASSRSR